MDCGPACLRMVASHYGKKFSLHFLRDRCHITRDGVSMLGISDAAESIGFHTKGVKLTWKQLRDNVTLPCIIHWEQGHFVVVYDIHRSRKGDMVHVADPAAGLLVYNSDDFCHSWLQTHDEETQSQMYGVALLLEPGHDFYVKYDEGDKSFGFIYILDYLRPYIPLIVQIIIAMLVSSGISLILPLITQSMVDIGIGTGDLSFVVLLLIAQVVLTFGQTANSLVRGWLMLHTSSRVSISLISDFLGKLMRLPISFFDSKMVGDMMQRIGDYSRVQSFLTGSLLSMAMALVSFVIYGVIMAGYDITVFLVFLFGAIFYVCWILAFIKQRRHIDYMRFREASANQSEIVQLIEGMQDIKLNNCEKQKRWRWESIQARLFRVNVKSLSLGQVQEVGGTFIEQTKNVLISFFAAHSVIDGEMSLGMMVALQYVIGQLNAPISQFIAFVQDVQDASISMERLGEVHSMDDEEPADASLLRDIPDNGDIILSNVSFQYDGPHSAKVLDGVSLRIQSHKVTAIVGASGSGKTTLLKLMLGFYRPISGEISLGGTPLSCYSPSGWRSRCGSVMQEGYIFSDSISGNIGVADESPDMSKVRKAADVSNIRDWIEQLPMGYNTKIGSEGHGLSTGQKQRILIARAAYKDAKYLFFDEATNSLDANNEKAIMENLCKFFENRTVVIVAHRLSTVKNADNIIVLDNGKIAEEGTHEQLTAIKGKYYTLVKNQLELGN